jgi:hypothetical protein
MVATTPVQHRQTNRQKHSKIYNRTTAINHAVRVIYRVCCLAGSASLIDNIRADLDADGVRAAMRKRDTAAVFDWLIAALSYQGISDQIAYDYMEQHGYARWHDINQKLAHGASCPKLKSYWHFHGCAYQKLSGTCAEPDHISRCPSRPTTCATATSTRPPIPSTSLVAILPMVIWSAGSTNGCRRRALRLVLTG